MRKENLILNILKGGLLITSIVMTALATNDWIKIICLIGIGIVILFNTAIEITREELIEDLFESNDILIEMSKDMIIKLQEKINESDINE